MSKAIRYIILGLFVAVYALSLDNTATIELTTLRQNWQSAFGVNTDKYGDLFYLCDLPEYKIPMSRIATIPLIKPDIKPQINLYTTCDSYLWYFIGDKKYFAGVDSLKIARINVLETLNVKLDPKKDNVLILEFAETNIRLFLNNADYLNKLVNPSKSNAVIGYSNPPVSKTSAILSDIKYDLFNKGASYNLEQNIWNTRLFASIKEFKADLNYKVFNIVNNDVVVSPDKKYLLVKSTVDTNQITSPFKAVSSNEVATMVKNLNSIYARAKSLGFNEVYLSLIPAPVTVLYENYNNLKYNNLINRIESSPELKAKVFDIYTTFKKTKLPIYYRSDLHWNMDGAYLWLNKFNAELADQQKKWQAN